MFHYLNCHFGILSQHFFGSPMQHPTAITLMLLYERQDALQNLFDGRVLVMVGEVVSVHFVDGFLNEVSEAVRYEIGHWPFEQRGRLRRRKIVML